MQSCLQSRTVWHDVIEKHCPIFAVNREEFFEVFKNILLPTWDWFQSGIPESQEALDKLSDNFTITNPSISGHPIIFASRNFLKMLGYPQEEVIVQNENIFQGSKTNRRAMMETREEIREERGIQVNLVNYRKEGMPFWMLFHMSPIFGKEYGRVIHFVVVQVPITRRKRGNGGLSLSEEASSLNEIMFGSCRKKMDTNFVLELGISDVSYKNYTVGGSLDWFDTLEKLDVNYQKWADSNNFSLGDFLSNDKWTSKYGRRQPFILAGSLMISVVVIVIGFSTDVRYILGDTTEHCREAFVFVIGFWMLDLANNTVHGPACAFWQIYQVNFFLKKYREFLVLINTILLKLYVVYGWLLETSWDFQLVLVGVGIDGFLSCKVELAIKLVPILKQHFLSQEHCRKWP
ncbi:Protein TWIN LOV 1 [Hibiscus syriacus]|uniref:Protein TWIN LOV 1 n=1 Tax=Hibiscus syriacus TaxID=106335 RepID=A0A6A2WCU0_HIBSY|nr:Protein TWIN LOV 1 [Hibiscus syriacus]